MSFDQPETKPDGFEADEVELSYTKRGLFRPYENFYIKGPRKVVEEFWDKIMEK